ncbi:hypothetical protein [Streptococcus parasanguinis]
MFNNLIKYYLKSAQTRINKRIDVINKERKVLKASGDKRYTDLKFIKNTHLYANKPKVIKEIRESKTDILAEKLTVTVAESLLSNIKLKPELITVSSDKSSEIKMKRNNLEFSSLQELLWGFDEVFTLNDQFNFFLHLFLDLENDTEYSSMVHDILVDYVPYARYSALEKATSEDTEFGAIFAPDYKNSNIDVFAESVYLFCMSGVSEEVMTRFINFLHTPYTYESKDGEGRFLIKEGSVNYQNFEGAFNQVLFTVLEPIFNMETYFSLGKRAYDIFIDDFKMGLDLMSYSMTRSPESYLRHLTESEKPDVDVMSELLKASEDYIERLAQAQQDFYGNIEEKYIESEMFSITATSYYSEDRFFQLVEQKKLMEIETYV